MPPVAQMKMKAHTMKIKSTLTLLALALAATTTNLLAQDGNQQPGQGGQRPSGGQRPPPPLVAALDANHDGVIDETEINQASTSLRKLDKNGDGKLTGDELRPPMGQGGQGQQGGGRPPGGQGQVQDGPPQQ